MIEKIISGGQSGVDRAALDVAVELGIPHGGWCPKGRLAELGEVIPSKYALKETASSDYSERTKANIADATGTIILVPNISIKITDGTNLTIQVARDTKKPYIIVDLSADEENNAKLVCEWLEDYKVQILNIAGPRESQNPGIYNSSKIFLKKLLLQNLTATIKPLQK